MSVARTLLCAKDIRAARIISRGADDQGRMPRLNIAPTLEGAPSKLRLGGGFLCNTAPSGKFRSSPALALSTAIRSPCHMLLPSEEASAGEEDDEEDLDSEDESGEENDVAENTVESRDENEGDDGETERSASRKAERPSRPVHVVRGEQGLAGRHRRRPGRDRCRVFLSASATCDGEMARGVTPDDRRARKEATASENSQETDAPGKADHKNCHPERSEAKPSGVESLP